ncbi:UDP-N-acetylglucosamine 2-epimerase [Carnobacterium antarcticum]|uniref:UDP-N-acetylglucosamine 2-epimerase n=1 Tax=Carnobacterium antarcticum TaxID=2126436 RepID=A0ABW4NL87_9LACT|nr:UDP-N-acetylglucosamine 2-epimerase [Carnobacterium sp. CP1]ALV21570.1 UDP-N-acetylglucosamine 2-epimerase [Carnobacterium sp. CP1]
MKKLCVVTGTRAEYGLLMPLLEQIKQAEDLELQLLVTGMHLSPEFGLTYKLIEADGYVINEKVDILLSSDTPVGISKSMGLGMIGFSESFERLQPDMVILLGDRYETFAAAAAASAARIPISHLHGGETTEGAFDEAFRHAITKMSWLHFTSAEEYRKRVIQLGEQPERVFNVGAIGIENIVKMPLMTKAELEASLGITFNKRLLLVTFHPVTLENKTSAAQFKELLEALDIVEDATIIFTKANSDTDGRIINQLIDDYTKLHSAKSLAFTSMGQLRYLSAMKLASAVIGNSSSGIIEAPSFKIPTVNIGDRQKGRMQAESVIDCEPKKEAIDKAIHLALSVGFHAQLKKMENPYGDGKVSEKIIKSIRDSLSKDISLKKSFHTI